VLLDMAEERGVGFADIDLARISDVRSRIPALNHRRPIPDAVTYDRLRSSMPRRRRDLRSLVPLERGL
jgi:predicted amidohydrolase